MVLPSDHVITDSPAFGDAVKQGSRTGRRRCPGHVRCRTEPTRDRIRLYREGRVCRVRLSGRQVQGETRRGRGRPSRRRWSAPVELGNVRLRRRSDPRRGQAAGPRDLDGSRWRLSLPKGPGKITLGETFSDIPATSIHHAVMENAANSVVVPLDAGWSDVGSWHSVWELSEQRRERQFPQRRCAGCRRGGDTYIRSGSKTVAVSWSHGAGGGGDAGRRPRRSQGEVPDGA